MPSLKYGLRVDLKMKKIRITLKKFILLKENMRMIMFGGSPTILAILYNITCNNNKMTVTTVLYCASTSRFCSVQILTVINNNILYDMF